MAGNDIEVRPYSSAIGAEIFGIDLTEPLDDESWSVIQDAFHTHCVIFFRDQPLTPQQQLAFAKHFGALVEYPFLNGIEGFPQLIEIVKTPQEIRNFGSGWHADMSFSQTAPLGAVVQALEMPLVGGDTMFCNMYLAYESLSEGMQELVARTNGIHDSHEPTNHANSYQGMAKSGKQATERQITVQPLVKAHPVTGRKSLFISPDYCDQLEDMTHEESKPVLDYLEQHATQHAFTCRFRWQPHSIVVWDNRCVMHNALEDDLGARMTGEGFKRVIRRATIGS